MASAARTEPGRRPDGWLRWSSGRLHALSQRKDVPRQAKRQRFLVEPIEEQIFSNLVRYVLDRWKVFLQRRRFRQEAIERRGAKFAICSASMCAIQPDASAKASRISATPVRASSASTSARQ